MSETIIANRITRRRNARKTILVALGLFVTIFVFTFLVQANRNNEMDVEAASLDGFDAGYIISDWQMGNYNSMTESEIQNFLTSKNSCGNRDYDYYLRLSRNSGYQWHWKDDHFVCLSEELFGDGETIGSGDTAAHILWQTAQDYKINPQALIVLLQKETGLITDPIPNNGDYRKATGYGCPDTAPCSSEYYGFKNQVRRAAALFRTVLNGGWTNYPLGENYIQYNPNADCGGSVVNVRSLATSALYRYTPYQPNQGAIDAGYGTAYCGAYGNRNFYLYFQDWFGGITNDYEEKLGRTIPDGKYQITLKQDNSKSFDIYGGIVPDMSYEKMITYNTKQRGADNQTFLISYASESGYYNIYNKASGLYLSTDDGKIVVSNKKGCESNWNIKRNDNESYTLLSSCNGKKVSRASNGDLVLTSDGNQSQWKFFEISDETHALEDGIYQISTALSDDYVLDIKGGVYENMTSAELNLWKRKFTNDEIDNQLFEVKYDKETGYYSIINRLSKLSLDVYNGDTTNGTKLIMWKSNNGCNQKWMIRKLDEYYEIISMCTGKAIDVPNSRVSNSQNLIIYNPQQSKNQKWSFDIAKEESIEDNEYYISANNTNIVLDIKGGIKEDLSYAEMITYEKKTNDYSNQVFKVKKNINDDDYYIYNPESGLYLDVYNGGTTNETQVILWQFNGGCNQRWKFERIIDYYKIRSVCSNKVLDVKGGTIVSGKSVIIYDDHNGINQKWYLVKNS